MVHCVYNVHHCHEHLVYAEVFWIDCVVLIAFVSSLVYTGLTDYDNNNNNNKQIVSLLCIVCVCGDGYSSLKVSTLWDGVGRNTICGIGWGWVGYMNDRVGSNIIVSVQLSTFEPVSMAWVTVSETVIRPDTDYMGTVCRINFTLTWLHASGIKGPRYFVLTVSNSCTS